MDLVFDLDGTLTDPALGVVRCMNYALTSFDYSPLPDAKITEHIGPPLEQTVVRLTGSDDATHIDAVAAAYRERYGEFGFKENTVYAGIPEMLQTLKDAGHKLGVCTSKLQINANRVINEFQLDRYFDFVNGSSNKSSKSEQLSDLLARGQISPEAIMIGDRAIDLSAAHENRLRSAGVLWGYGSRDELAELEPTYLVETPVQLLTAIAA